MTDDLGVLASIAYDAGISPLDFAEEQVTIQLGVYLTVMAVGEQMGFPLDAADLSIGAAARRILGALLDAGWTPPEVPHDGP